MKYNSLVSFVVIVVFAVKAASGSSLRTHIITSWEVLLTLGTTRGGHAGQWDQSNFCGCGECLPKSCLHKRCIRCRSRGELGTCGDPFPFNVTEPDAEVGIHVVACPSGWCGKMMEGSTGAFRADDYGTATQRMCLQRPPSDYEERCAYTIWNHRKVYMCFCNGDLCNSALSLPRLPSVLSLTILLTLYNCFRNV